MKTSKKTSAVVIVVLVECLNDHGVTADDIETRTGLRREEYDHPDINISVEKLIKLWVMAIEVTGDPALTVHLRSRYGAGLTHFVNCLSMNSLNGFEALQNWSRYTSLVCDTNRVEVTEENDIVKTVFTNLDLELQNPWTTEYTFCQLTDYARDLIGSDFTPVDISFQHACYSDSQAFADYFGCPVYFEQDRNSYRCRKEPLFKPFRERNPHLQSVLIEKAESDLLHQVQASSFTDKVVEFIIDELPKGNLTIELICDLVGMSRSTLHRRLKEENTSFNQLVNDIRKDLSKTYLKQGMNVTQIAFLLGYSTAGNFLSAFKRWFGMNPTTFRRLNHNNMG